MERITIKHLRALADRLNKLTGSPMVYRAENGKAAIGHYHISGAYGGWCLHRIMNDGGGVTCPIAQGHIPARELYEQMHAYIRGLELSLRAVDVLREVNEVIALTDPEYADAHDLRHLSGADVVECLCELQPRINAALGVQA